MKGTTFSITLPQKVVKYYDSKKEELGMSRSSIIRNIILADYELKKTQDKVNNNVIASSNSSPE